MKTFLPRRKVVTIEYLKHVSLYYSETYFQPVLMVFIKHSLGVRHKVQQHDMQSAGVPVIIMVELLAHNVMT